ncbi:MAG: AAA family ATPase [Desulfuromonadales bacterium]|nr:AAA family ATPase [Desulfuromonadales bacterium]
MIRTTLKSLMKPDSYPEAVSCVELIQTHVSYIFLTDLHAYKIKKPVDFGFLNFSTIDRRRFYCNEEVRLNRRLCPDIYEGVVELRETAAGAAFHGTGTIIDYAVKMKRLPADRMLDRLVDAGDVTPAAMRKISAVIAEFHRTAPTSPAIAEYGHQERIMYNWQENFDQVIPFENSTLPAGDRELLRSWVVQFAAEHEELFQKRVDDGFIRECDGDIHLDNICLDNGVVHIFDCIEFNERFRCCDTAADIAFLLMDLDYHGRHDLADDVIDEYVSITGDRGVTELIDFYRIYRAFVRGKVESFRLNDAGINPDDQASAKVRAVRYFRLARGYVERRRLKPTLFITCGLMGSGKSTLAAQLAFELGINTFSSDSTRKQAAGLAPEVPVREAYGEGLYNRQASEATYAGLLCTAEDQLQKGRSVIIDAGFILKSQRVKFAELARRHSVPFIILQTDCSEAENRRRLQDREAGGKSVSDGRLELLAFQAAEFEAPDGTEGMLISLASNASPAALADEIHSRLAP